MPDPILASQTTPADPVHAPAQARAHGPEAALRLQVIRQQGQLDRQAARLDERTAQIAALAARLRDSDARLAALAEEAHALRAEVTALRNSRSWRITGPLRALRRAGWWLGRLGRAPR